MWKIYIFHMIMSSFFKNSVNSVYRGLVGVIKTFFFSFSMFYECVTHRSRALSVHRLILSDIGGRQGSELVYGRIIMGKLYCLHWQIIYFIHTAYIHISCIFLMRYKSLFYINRDWISFYWWWVAPKYGN